MSETVLEGLLFDGRSAAATPVRIAIAGGVLTITTPDGALLSEHGLARLTVTEAFATAPRQIGLPGGGVVEVPDGAALAAALSAAGRRPGLVDWLEARWRTALAAVVVCVAVIVAAYLYGLPAAAGWIARTLPASAERRLGDGVLELLDGHVLRPTALSEEEQRAAQERIDEAARLGAPAVKYRLLFRSAGFGPSMNAFALPGGTVVVLDGLVRGTASDDRLVAIVGHELGHVARRHSAQALLKSAGVGAAASLLWGDFSGQAAAIPAALAMFDYSRDAEREADEDAVRFLRAAGRSALPMAEALCLLQCVEREASLGAMPRLLSTHPKLAERIQHVRELRGVDPSYRCPEPAPAGSPCGPDEDDGDDEPGTCGAGEAPRPSGD
ncbi:M48 family metallopeptidase [Anaeromyxobacter dehalogenans]|uniref:Peptidase M48, Ste24p n=1 Tax=Anaeromyxobacter dehalogenans (strain 2CP-C) TaxID=290397 RepID=Q2IFE3_ANADE|nr:M48 family metallopeptidase [Anaeromyxobacter dehalogenans]ABC83300.1 peptidase M48, Ste24p [Anaeromyxobacter dehalogenans 2CP-C]